MLRTKLKKIIKNNELTKNPSQINGKEKRGEFHISHDASRQISVFSPRSKERSRVSREIFNDLNFKMPLIQGKFQ